MSDKPNYAQTIRDWVAVNFNGYGEFRTRDVVHAIDNDPAFPGEVDSGYVSAALNGWSKYSLIVKGIRLRRHDKDGKRPTWECIPAYAPVKQGAPGDVPSAPDGEESATGHAGDVPRPKTPLAESHTEKTAQSASETSRRNRSNSFRGQILDTRKDGAMIIRTDDGLFKVTPFEW